jgi:hypothetical protein
MKIIPEVLDALDEYHERSLLMQKYYFEKQEIENIEQKVNDDLIFNVPIYDMLDRRYAAFSSFLEALDKKEDDPKGNGIRFKDHKIDKEFDLFVLYYLFRLCGSGINYKPGSHGFGNFWIVDLIEKGYYTNEKWIQYIPENKFCDNKGYLLPQFSIGLKGYIEKFSIELVHFLYNEVLLRKHNIIELVDKGNDWLRNRGFKRQNFVLSAFAADVAEYFPQYVDPSSMIYAGTNAKKCIRAIFGRCDESEAIDFLAKRYNSIPYSVEDSRLCDPVRYFLDYQSRYHIEKNNGKVFQNNSLLKKIWTQDQYKSFQLQLQK